MVGQAARLRCSLDTVDRELCAIGLWVNGPALFKSVTKPIGMA